MSKARGIGLLLLPPDDLTSRVDASVKLAARNAATFQLCVGQLGELLV
jgi:hypothetical protein